VTKADGFDMSLNERASTISKSQLAQKLQQPIDESDDMVKSVLLDKQP